MLVLSKICAESTVCMLHHNMLQHRPWYKVMGKHNVVDLAFLNVLSCANAMAGFVQLYYVEVSKTEVCTTNSYNNNNGFWLMLSLV